MYDDNCLLFVFGVASTLGSIFTKRVSLFEWSTHRHVWLIIYLPEKQHAFRIDTDKRAKLILKSSPRDTH